MANYATLKAAIAAAIKENGNNEITGNLLQQQLLAMVNSLGANYQFAGIATPSTNPGTPDQNVFYIASQAGTYVNFSNIIVYDNQVAILKYNGSWTKEITGAAPASSIHQNYIVAYTYGTLDITTDRVFTVSGGNLVCRIGAENYVIPEGSTFTLSNISSAAASLWAIIFDTDNLQLIAREWNNTIPTNKIIAFVTALDGEKIISVPHCIVPFRFNGRYFNPSQLLDIQREAKAGVLLKNAPLMIDTVNKTISTGQGSDLAFLDSNGRHILSNYTKNYSDTPKTTTLYYVVYDYVNNQIKVLPYNGGTYENWPVVFKMSVVYGTMDITNVYDCAVPVTVDSKYFDDKQAEEIREIGKNSYSLLTPYLWEKFKLHWTHNGDGTYAANNTRNAIDTPMVFDEDIYISVQSGYKFAVQYFDGPETGSSHLTYASPWFTSTHVIPANTYFCVIVSNIEDTETTERETESLSFSNTRYGNKEMFNTLEQIKEISDVVFPPDNGINYYGERIQMCLFRVENFKSLVGATWAQSMAIYNNYVIFFNNENQTAKLFSIETGQLLETFSIPNGGYYNPHCNTACVGNEFVSANSIMPVIYLSQWDAGHERACFVYDVQLNNGVYSLTLVQKINLSAVSSNLIGAGECDFAVDKVNNEIYAFAYKTSVYTDYGTATMVCKFALPLLSDGSEILITDADVLDHFEMALVKYRQDAFFNNGRIYLANGGLSDVKAHISVIDVEQKKIITNVPIYKYLDGEPECLDMYGQTKILFNYGTGLLNLRY